MYEINIDDLNKAIAENVSIAIAEDVASGDISAALIPSESLARAEIITRQNMVLAGKAWAEEVFHQIDAEVEMKWHYNDGDQIEANELIVEIHGSARSLLTGERSALNFIQLLSAVATKTQYFVNMVDNSDLEVIDTRKTLPGLRLAQKYAVTCGGGRNHRMGLYDAFLIKENHISACGGIENAVNTARVQVPGKLIEVETETLEELDQALKAGADIIMLDNFSLEDTKIAVEKSRGKAKIEASGGINEETLKSISTTGVDFISMGTLTKDIKAVDLSMRLYM